MEADETERRVSLRSVERETSEVVDRAVVVRGTLSALAVDRQTVQWPARRGGAAGRCKGG